MTPSTSKVHFPLPAETFYLHWHQWQFELSSLSNFTGSICLRLGGICRAGEGLSQQEKCRISCSATMAVDGQLQVGNALLWMSELWKAESSRFAC